MEEASVLREHRSRARAAPPRVAPHAELAVLPAAGARL
jgi:hypothetical protein